MVPSRSRGPGALGRSDPDRQDPRPSLRDRRTTTQRGATPSGNGPPHPQGPTLLPVVLDATSPCPGLLTGAGGFPQSVARATTTNPRLATNPLHTPRFTPLTAPHSLPLGAVTIGWAAGHSSSASRHPTTPAPTAIPCLTHVSHPQNSYLREPVPRREGRQARPPTAPHTLRGAQRTEGIPTRNRQGGSSSAGGVETKTRVPRGTHPNRSRSGRWIRSPHSFDHTGRKRR